MAINLTSYPVETVSGIIQNAFAGFKPITLAFQRTASEIAVECVLVDPDDSEIDLLGFSLYADFDLLGNAVIDVSIINDKNSQGPILTSQENTDSRIKYRVKYREAGTENVYLTISEEPIIAVYSIEQFDLDKWLTSVIEPNLWLGYPNMSGFVHSDANDIGLDLVVRYDLLDIQKSVLFSDQLLFDYADLAHGVCIADLFMGEGVLGEVYPAINGGYAPATDWINPTNGLAENWGSQIFNGSGTYTIVTGNGFLGNAQRMEAGAGAVCRLYSIAITGLNPNIQYTLMFKQRNYGVCSYSIIYPSMWGGISPDNLGVPKRLDFPLSLGTTSFIVGFEVQGGGSWLEVSEVRLEADTTQGITEDTEYIDYKIITE